jgi:membrane-bound lytic murein transglycosylase B
VPILRELCRGREGAGDARLASIRLLLLAWLVLSAGLPATAHAAPTPSPTIPPPARAPGIALSPSALPHPTEASTPAAGVAPASPARTGTALPTRTTATPTRTPPPTVGSLPAGAPSTRPGSQPTTGIHGVSDAAPASTDSASIPSPDACAAGDACGAGEEEVEAPLDWREFVPTDVADHLATMDRAARDSGCGVPWHLLAAISRVESNFGRNMATSSAGAIGYGQFLPQSWQAFGSDGNAYDYRDALPAIAAYLCQAGLARDPRAALFAYNHADR